MAKIKKEDSFDLEKIIEYIQKNEDKLTDVGSFFNKNGTYVTRQNYGKELLRSLCNDLIKKFK